MEEFIFVTFFKAIPEMVHMSSALYIVALVVFVLCAALQIWLMRTGKPDILLPGSLLAGEVCAETFFQAMDGGDEKIFFAMGFVFVAGFLAGEIVTIVYKIIRNIQKLRRAKV